MTREELRYLLDNPNYIHKLIIALKDTPDAVYEEWKARLQTRSEGIYFQTGSEEEASGAECSSEGNGESGESS